LWGPVITNPVDEFGWFFLGEAFPPNPTLWGERHIGEDGIALRDSPHGIRVGITTGAGSNAEETVFRVYYPQVLVVVGGNPSNIVTSCFGRPTFQRRINQREVGFTGCRWERTGNGIRLTLWTGELQK